MEEAREYVRDENIRWVWKREREEKAHLGCDIFKDKSFKFWIPQIPFSLCSCCLSEKNSLISFSSY